jgi:predicted N-formylglutamate amidohydrolase|tara:strand:- start:295 stop:1101 length:807 start_codon:yes stop_codon:yes gene_type:complete
MDAQNSYACPEALDERDPAPVLCLNGEAARPVLLIADHAGNAVPQAMNGLGLGVGDLTRHVAWDPGAAAVAEGLAEQWQVTAVLAQYSRLIVDPNRPLGDAAAMPKISDGTPIPANQDLGAEERRRRAELFYFPYHNTIDQEIARLRQAGPGPLVVSIHSFTPDYGDEERPWHVGIMSAADRRLAEALLKSLAKFEDFVVGDNQPYSGVNLGYTLRLHGGAQGLASVQIEIRQDLLTEDNDTALWIDILDDALSPLLDDPALLAVEFF